MRVVKFASAAMAGAFLGLILIGNAALAGPTLDGVKSRGVVTCAVNTGLAGFGMPDQQGDYKGLDADTCRAIAAAVLGDAKKVKFIPTTTQQRFTVLQSGEADVLTRNTTWTLLRDTEQGFNFAPV
ncbi:MAG TPA: transporter substrate-binding domain-containing protein, partial [Stellaceae bacterium]